MKELNKFINDYGWFGFIRFALYPISLFVITPIRLIQSLAASLILLKGGWKHYPHFDLTAGIVALYYRTSAINLYKYGRTGTTPYLGIGAFPLSKFFHYSKPSLYITWKGGAFAILLSMLGWLASHLIWIQTVPFNWVICVLLLAFISTTFYIMTFKGQNYNVVGWMFLPLILYGIYVKNWIIVGVALLMASYGSITVVFISNILLAVVAVSNFSLLPLLAVIPSNVKILTHFLPLLKRSGSNNILLTIMKGIGMIDKEAIYKRKYEKSFSLLFLYKLTISLQFLLVAIYFSIDFPILLLTGIIIFIINSLKIRFADEQSMYMLMLSLGTATAVTIHEPIVLVSFWILASPIPALAGLHNFKNSLDNLPLIKPCSNERLINKMKSFLEPVNQGQRVLMAWNSPNGIYEKIFDGYRQLIELPLYVAAEKEIHLMPDWWGVFETNYVGAPTLWGRDVETVKKNLAHWKADFAIIYQDGESVIDPKWEQAGYETLSHFNWSVFSEDFKNYKKTNVNQLNWYLLSIKSQENAS